MQVAQGDLPAALTSYRASLAIAERLAKADPGNAELAARSLGVAQQDRRRAGCPGRSARRADELPRLACHSPNGWPRPIRATQSWQRDLIVSYVKLSDVTGDKMYDVQALDIALAMQKRGILAPRDGWMIEDLRRRAGQ